MQAILLVKLRALISYVLHRGQYGMPSQGMPYYLLLGVTQFLSSLLFLVLSWPATTLVGSLSHILSVLQAAPHLHES